MVLQWMVRVNGQQRGFLIAYTLGLLDAGASVDEVVQRVQSLEQRALTIETRRASLIW